MSTTPSQRPRQPEARRQSRKGGSTRKITGIKRTAQPDAAPATTQERLRHYAPKALVPNLAIVLGVIAVCFAVILVGGWSLTYLPGAVGEAWLALHGVPLRIDGVTLSAMPLLPVIGVVAVIAAQVRKATAGRVSVLDLLALLGLVLGAPLVLSIIALFMVFDASHVYAVEMPPVALALMCPVIVHLVGFVLGVRRVVWRALAKRRGVPVEAVDAAASAARLSTRLFAAAGVVYVVTLALGYNRVSDLLAQYPQLGAGDTVALLLLSVLYLSHIHISEPTRLGMISYWLATTSPGCSTGGVSPLRTTAGSGSISASFGCVGSTQGSSTMPSATTRVTRRAPRRSRKVSSASLRERCDVSSRFPPLRSLSKSWSSPAISPMACLLYTSPSPRD